MRVDEEFGMMKAALEPVEKFIKPDPVVAAVESIDRALSTPADIFHYAGRGRVEHGQGILECDRPLHAARLGKLLRGSRVSLAVLNTCYSGRSEFAQPLIESGLPVLIGSWTSVTNSGAISFCRELYSCLAVGSLIDEAVALARRRHFEAVSSSNEDIFEWGAFVVYMSVTQAILFPKPDDLEARSYRDALTEELQRISIDVINNIGTNYGTVYGVSAQ